MGGAEEISSIAELRHGVRHALELADQWLGSAPLLDVRSEPSLDPAGATPDGERLNNMRRTVRQLKVRASSALINVAFVGGFSSGKSFLIGALQHRLEYEPVVSDNEEEIESARYMGLLFSGPQETTACPATVVPVDVTDEFDASGHGFLRVKFVGNDEWVNIANSPPPAVVAAYTTQDQEVIINRLTAHHREQTVAEVEILLADAAIPAKLYDLPGHGSMHPIHDEISNKSWADADCFVFTTQATHTLGKDDHELISRLYDHHINSGKRIIWVVTGIDRANVARNLSDKKVAWLETVEKDNQYLRTYFPSSNGQVDTFYGPDGFMPVSPAWEAYGEWMRAQGNGQEASGAKYISASRMGRLRQIVNDLIEAGVGHKHLANIAREARALLSSHLSLIVELLDTAKLPLEKLAAEKDDLHARLRYLQSAIPDLREQLNAALQVSLRKIEREFRGLPEYLHAELDDRIRAADLTKEKEASLIDARKTQLLKRWAAGQGPEHTWREESRAFMDVALSNVQVIIGDTRPVDRLGAPGTRINLEQLRVSPSERYRTGAQDIIGQVSKIVGLSTPVVGGIAAAAGLISGPFIVLPAGLTLAAGLVYGLIRRNKGRADTLDLLRRAWIQSLDEAAREYQAIFILAISARATEVIDRAVEILAERSIEISRKILLAESSLTAPDNASRTDLVSRLEPYCQKGEDLITRLTELMSQ
jgi:hypothetical protein